MYVYMYMYVYLYMYACLYVCVCNVYVCILVCMLVCTCMHMYVYVHVLYMYVCMHLHVSVYVIMYMYVYLYACICMYVCNGYLSAISTAYEFQPYFLGAVSLDVEVEEARVIPIAGETGDESEDIVLGTLVALVLALGQVDVLAVHLTVLLRGHHVVAVGGLHDNRRPRHTQLLQRVLVQNEPLLQQRAEHIAAVGPASDDVDVAVRGELSKVEEGHQAVVGHEGVVVAAGGHLVHGEVERVARHVWVRVEVPRAAHVPVPIVHVGEDVEVRLVVLPQPIGDGPVEDGVLLVGEAAFKAARLVHVAKNGRAERIAFVCQLSFRGVDCEVPVGLCEI